MKRRSINRKATCSALFAASLLMMFAVTGAVQAAPQIMSAYGDQLPWYSAEVNAMGGTGTALYRGGISNILNPAMLADEKSYRLDAGFAMDQESEDRFQPLFDTFDNYVVDAAIASNRQEYWHTGFGFAGRILEETFPMTVGLSLTDRYAFGYTFEEELRNPLIHNVPNERDAILETRKYEVEGTLRNLSLGVGFDVTEIVSVGAAVHYAFGTRTQTATVRDDKIDLGEDDESYHNQAEYDLGGVNYTLGIRARVNERVQVGAVWESQLTADGNFAFSNYTATPDTTIMSSYEGYHRYPNIYRVGLTFMPRTDPRTTFSLEYEYKPWSEMADSQYPGFENPQHLNDVNDVKVGLEHMFYNGMPIRFGFRYIDSYEDSEASTSMFSAGLGIPFGDGMFSASVELSKISSVQPHIFGYPGVDPDGSYETGALALVEDTRFRVGLGYKLNF